MRPSTCRRFTLLDVMILTAATGVGFALMRLCWPRSGNMSPHAVREWGNATLGVGLIAWTLAFLPIRLIRPRRRLDRLMCQPGLVACCAALFVIVAGVGGRLLAEIGTQILGRHRSLSEFLHSFWYVYDLPVGPAVAAAWLALVLSGRWRPERGWIDRLGRGLGALWIAFIFLQWEFGRWTSSAVQLLTLMTRHH